MHEPPTSAPAGEVTGRVVGLWHGCPLSPLRRVCLASQVLQGYAVTLYSYDPVRDLPDGVANGDAGTVLPLAFRNRLQPALAEPGIELRATIQLSDFFRYRALRMGLGIWLDTDLYLFRRMPVEEGRPHFAWESWFQLGNSVVYLPGDHPIVDAFEELMAQDDLIPDWLELHHRAKAAWWRFRGRPFVPADLKLSLFGPRALTVLARRSGAVKHALPLRSYYAIHARHERFFDASGFAPLHEDPAIIGVHLSPKRRENEPPASGSLYEWAARNVGMLPER